MNPLVTKSGTNKKNGVGSWCYKNQTITSEEWTSVEMPPVNYLESDLVYLSIDNNV